MAVIFADHTVQPHRGAPRAPIAFRTAFVVVREYDELCADARPRANPTGGCFIWNKANRTLFDLSLFAPLPTASDWDGYFLLEGGRVALLQYERDCHDDINAERARVVVADTSPAVAPPPLAVLEAA